jgi:class 3 adenylate cyclase
VSRTAALVLALFYGVLGVVLVFAEQTLAAGRPPPAADLSTLLFGIVFVGNLGLIVVLEVVLLRRLTFEKARAERLLLNVLPAEVANELKETGTTLARRFESVSVLFADVVGFTQIAARSSPEDALARLNAVFTGFDELVLSHGCEKIHTIGDAYVAAAGVPVESTNHADVIAALALDMRELVDSTDDLDFRLGISSGPVVGGVIGSTKFQYDIWGDTVNVASRMESQGLPGRIQLSETTVSLLSGDFVLQPRGEIEVKGKGQLRTWFLETGPAPGASAGG